MILRPRSLTPALASLLLLWALPGAAQTINTLEYFLTDDETKELHTGNTGDTISQKTIGNALFRVKWRNPQSHEYYTWDSNYIYLRYDNTWGGAGGATSYEFTEYPGKGGRWMLRQMTVGVPLTVSHPTGQKWYTSTCGVHSTPALEYTNTLVAYYPSYNIGGALGTDSVIVLKYDWDKSPSDNHELFFFSKKWGWIRWEHWAGGVQQSGVNWNQISTRTAVAPSPKCVAFPSPCAPPFTGCPGVWECTGRQCFVQPPSPGECQSGYDWCFAGCCCRCR